MQRKERFPPEPDTRPDILTAKVVAKRHSMTAPKKPIDRRELPTDPPPPPTPRKRPTVRPGKPEKAEKAEDARPSVVRVRRPTRSNAPAATVDEVVADLSKDPRRERE
jgi:hypothetical protein